MSVAVNVSRLQLRNPSFVDVVWSTLFETRLDPGALTLEVTETAMTSNPRDVLARLDKLAALGVRLAMDDFGTGYSSLSQLRQLPVDVMKIDRAFVSRIARSDEEWSLTTAIVGLAKSLGKTTLAEGVEEASQLAHLRSLGCQLGQGYLFARPMPVGEIHEFLAATNGRSRESRPPAVGDLRL